MSAYKLSFVIPIYGVEQYIVQFAESVFEQTYHGIEYVFVNDGTKDASMEILERLIDEKYAHLRPDIVIVNQENQGLPVARKTGLEHAHGEYILFADSDDWLELDAVEKVMKKAEETDADIIYFDLVKEYAHRRSYKRERNYSGATREKFIINIFNYRSYGYTVTKCFRRNLYTDHVIYIPKIGMHEDIYLMTQLIFYARSIVRIPEALYHYRKDNPNSICAQGRRSRNINSSRNLLDLYYNYRNNLKGSPIEKVADGIVLRAGWHAVKYKVDLYGEFPWLAEAIDKARMSCSYLLPIHLQAYIKWYNRRKR